MQDVTNQDRTFVRLQKHARPLLDSVDSVSNRAIDALERNPASSHGPIPAERAERQIDPRALPNLTHTRVLDASIEGHRIDKPNWNLLLGETMRRALRHGRAFDELRRLCGVNMVKGQETDDGYSHLPDIDISIQAQGANSACRAVVTVAQDVGMAVDIGVLWRHKQGSAHPGESGRLIIPGTNSAASQSAP
jgi:hypothetical protein